MWGAAGAAGVSAVQGDTDIDTDIDTDTDVPVLSPSCGGRMEQQGSVLQQALGQLKSLGQRVSFASSRMDVLKSRPLVLPRQ